MPLPQDIWLTTSVWVIWIGHQTPSTSKPFLWCLVEVPLWALELLRKREESEQERRCGGQEPGSCVSPVIICGLAHPLFSAG